MAKRPPAILVDLDGTLFQTTDSVSPLTTVNTSVLSIVEGMHFSYRWRTVILTSRNERQREETTVLLQSLSIEFDDMFMRKVDDTSADSVFKRWALDMLILPKYNVKLSLEDDPSVAKVFRTLNIPCFLVNEWSAHEAHGFTPARKPMPLPDGSNLRRIVAP